MGLAAEEQVRYVAAMMTPRTRIFRDIGELVTCSGPPLVATEDRSAAAAAAEAALGLVHDAAVVVVDGRIAYAGPAAGMPGLAMLRMSTGWISAVSSRVKKPPNCQSKSCPRIELPGLEEIRNSWLNFFTKSV